MNNYRINRLSIGLIMLAAVLFLNSCSYRLTNERREAITKQEHGYLHFIFRDRHPFIFWDVEVNINDEKYFDDIFKGGDVYIVPVVVGKIILKYKIIASIRTFPQYLTGTSSLGLISEKNLGFDLKPNQHVYLKMVDVGKEFFGLGSAGTCTPWFKTYQDVAFVIDRIEEGKPGKDQSEAPHPR